MRSMYAMIIGMVEMCSRLCVGYIALLRSYNTHNLQAKAMPVDCETWIWSFRPCYCLVIWKELCLTREYHSMKMNWRNVDDVDSFSDTSGSQSTITRSDLVDEKIKSAFVALFRSVISPMSCGRFCGRRALACCVGVRNWIQTHMIGYNVPMWSKFPVCKQSHPEPIHLYQ